MYGHVLGGLYDINYCIMYYIDVPEAVSQNSTEINIYYYYRHVDSETDRQIDRKT